MNDEADHQEQQEPEPPPTPAPAPPADLRGVAYNDRVLALGYTQSGKSELLNVLFSGVRCQRLLIDVKDEFAIADVERVSSIEALDWEQPILHYVPGPATDPRDWDRLFETCFRRRHLSVAMHELAFLSNYTGRVGPHVNAYLSQGAAHGLGLKGGTQRPFCMPVYAKSEADHVFAMVPRLSTPDDHKAMAEAMRLRPDELAHELDTLENEHGRYSFLWWDRRARSLTSWAPLPEQVRAQSVVTRRTVA